MPSFMYDQGRMNLGGNPPDSQARLDLDTDTFAMFFVDEADDTPNQTSDNDVADRLAASQVPAFASAPNLTSLTLTAVSNRAVMDAADLTFTALSGDQSESVDLFKDTGTDTTSTMVANFDDYTGLPLTPSGSDVVIVFASTGIIRI